MLKAAACGRDIRKTGGEETVQATEICSFPDQRRAALFAARKLSFGYGHSCLLMPVTLNSHRALASSRGWRGAPRDLAQIARSKRDHEAGQTRCVRSLAVCAGSG